MAKKTSLTEALQGASGKPPVAEATQQATANKLVAGSTTYVPPSRQGRKAVTGHFDPAVAKQLKQIALDNDTTVQALLAEALNDLFVKYSRNPIA